MRAAGSSVLEVQCPTGSDLTISTASGAVDVEGDAGSVKVTTKSGNLSIERATAVDARGASGKVEVGVCTGDCHVVFVSSNVRIGEAAKATVATVSGNIDVGAADVAEVKTVSGNISVAGNAGGPVAGAVHLGLGEDLGTRRIASRDAPEGRVGTRALRVRAGARRRGARRNRQWGDLGHMPVTTVSGTIVFTDIVGFTQLTDEHGDDVALTLLERQEAARPPCAAARRPCRQGARRRTAAVVRRPERGDRDHARAAARVRGRVGGRPADVGAHRHALRLPACAWRRHRRPRREPRVAHHRPRRAGRGVVLRGDGRRSR